MLKQHDMKKCADTEAEKPPTKWLVICVGLVALIVAAVKIFKVPLSNVFYVGVLLACPLVHFWMMKDGGHKH